MSIKGVIFDLDGVICFTDEYHYLAWKEMADSMGIYFDREINNRLRGVSRMASLEIILERYTGPALTEEKKAEGNSCCALGDALSLTQGVGEAYVLVSENGVVVVCDGAQEAKIRMEITEAVKAYTGFGADRITILKRDGTK